MAPPREPDNDDLTDRERAHVMHRDRKRVTPMVVDGASVRRILPALERKREEERSSERDPNR